MANYRYSTPEYMRCAVTSRQPDHSTLAAYPIAMAYVPWQEWHFIYDVEKGLHCGTIFKELHKPFSGTGGCS